VGAEREGKEERGGNGREKERRIDGPGERRKLQRESKGRGRGSVEGMRWRVEGRREGGQDRGNGRGGRRQRRGFLLPIINASFHENPYLLLPHNY